MEKYKVSVIIPIYNAENYIDRCIKSVKDQTLNSIEIILINDGSTDNSKQKCEFWIKQSKDIKLINKVNKGAGAARNAGIEEAEGEYIFFLDADDYLPQNALEILYTQIINIDCDIICGTSMSISKNGNTHKNTKIMNQKKYIGSGRKIINKTKYKGIPPMVWLYMYRKNFINNNHIRFSEGVCLEDCEFNLKSYYYAKKIAFIEDITYYQFMSDNSVMRSKNVKKSKDAIIIAKNIENFIKYEVKENKIKLYFIKYVAYLYAYGLHYAMEIDEKIDDIITSQDEKKHIIKILRKNIKYLPLAIALRLSKIEIYKRLYLKYYNMRRN